VFNEPTRWALGVQRDPFGGFGLGGLGGHLGMGQRAHRMGIGFCAASSRGRGGRALLVAVAKPVAALS
jgi:hypothetical protein